MERMRGNSWKSWIAPVALGVALVLTAIFVGQPFGKVKSAKATTLYTLTTDTFTSSGVWTAPAGVNSVVVEAWGAGGGGKTNVGGGGGGAYVSSTVPVTPGNAYYVVVGTSAAATTGTDSTFATTTVVANGGGAGWTGKGGTTAASTGDTKFAGGDATGGINSDGGAPAGNRSAGSTKNGGQDNGITTTGASTNAHGDWGEGGGSSAASQTAGTRGQVRVNYMAVADATFPIINGKTWGRDIAFSNLHQVYIPTSTQSGDLLIIIATVAGSSTGTTMDINSGGWTKLGQTNPLGSSAFSISSQAVFYKVAAGGDTASVSSSGSAVELSYITYDIGNYSGIPFGAKTSSTNSGASTNINPPSLNTGSSQKYLWIATGGSSITNAGGAATYTSPPANFQSFIIEPGVPDPFTFTADRFNETQTLDPGTFTNTEGSFNNWSSWTIAIAGPVSGGTVAPIKKQSEFFFD